MLLPTLLLASLPTLFALPSSLHARDGTVSYVNFSNNTGTPKHLASGFIYGIPDTQNQIPDSFYTGMGFNYARAGGAQVQAPGRGWIWGLTEYKNRFNSVLSNYRTARKYNAQFVFLPHDLWGADSTQNSSAPYPGDNGNWAYYDSYLTQLFGDMKANGMVDGVIWDTWNEPDLGTVFWGRSQQQYLDMFSRTYSKVRSTFPSMPISGPSSSGEPSLNNGWWTNFASYIKSNNCIPDQWSWHMETGGSSSMSSAYSGFQAVLKQYGLPQKPVNINEYAIYDEQVSSGAAWWISQLERVNAIGLRGNWLSASQLHDFLASLLSKPGAPGTYSATGTGYYTNGEYQVYKYYANSMTGYRVGTTPSSDLALDTYATVDTSAKRARVLVGVRLQQGTWYVQLDNLSALGLPTSGSLNIHTYGFPDQGHYGQVNGPNDLGYYSHDYTGNSVRFPIYQNDKTTAYAFDFALP